MPDIRDATSPPFVMPQVPPESRVIVPAQFPSKPFNGIAFVGEAPGSYEVEGGKPLIGPSGKLFNSLLRLSGIDREASLVTNVFPLKAQRNDVTPWMRDAEFTAQALRRLWWELETVKPMVIVPMGGTALWAFTDSSKIGDVRGSAMYSSRVLNPDAVGPQRWKLLPTYHPAFLPKMWKMFPVTIRDFVHAKHEAAIGPKIIYPKRRLHLEPTLHDLELWRPKLLASDLLSVDIETGWGMLTNIGFAPNEEEALNVPFVDLRQTDKSYWRTPEQEAKAWRFVIDMLQSPTPKLGQNFAHYDYIVLKQRYGIGPRALSEDTRLLHHALYPELPKSLKFMQGSYSRQGVWKSWGTKAQEEKRDG